MIPELRQVRSFVAVAERASFTAAARELHVAQQAVSQQIQALEKTLGVTLLRRSSRSVELTPAGAVFLADARRLLSSADRAVRRVQAAARGEAGSLRMAYTLTTAYDTVPAVLASLAEAFPQLKIDAREVFGGDLVDLFDSNRCDIALAPKTSYPQGFRQRAIRHEPLRVAVGERHALADRTHVELSELWHERFEFWPREMAPGFYGLYGLGLHRAGARRRLGGQLTHRTAPARRATCGPRPAAATPYHHRRLASGPRTPHRRSAR